MQALLAGLDLTQSLCLGIAAVSQSGVRSEVVTVNYPGLLPQVHHCCVNINVVRFSTKRIAHSITLTGVVCYVMTDISFHRSLLQQNLKPQEQ